MKTIKEKIIEILCVQDLLEHKTYEQQADEILSLTQWVSVKDRLPENNCYVLACKSNGLISQMSYHAPFDSGKRIFQWWAFGYWLDQNSQVTHWMPLPELPKINE